MFLPISLRPLTAVWIQSDGICLEDADLGSQTRKDIYKASANAEVFQMLSTYFGDFAHALDTVGFG
jgi:hypothetical protein